MTYYAHTVPGQNAHCWQLLADHLRGVAGQAQLLALEALPNQPWFHETAAWVGWNHDLGKYRPEFQAYLAGRPGTVGHKYAGAAAAFFHHQAQEAAFAIAGHHGGLPDPGKANSELKEPGGKPALELLWPAAIADCPNLEALAPPALPASAGRLQRDLWTRLLFSCLVDADWRDTSAFHERTQGFSPEPPPPALDPAARLEQVMKFIAGRASQCRDERLKSIRREILEAVLSQAELPPGLFTLTVPTGGGKTLSALAFALTHAAAHSLRRIIYVAPFLTILEQNARAIRQALGLDDHADDVFEHHSLAEADAPPRAERGKESTTKADEAESAARLLRAERWDAPVVLTTNVQFLESLFSNHPGQCRKLHNVCRSVVILDECQALPPGLTKPTCAMLNQWAELTGTTLILCTATQPAWNDRPGLEWGLRGVRELAPDPDSLFSRLKRVRVQWPAPQAAGWSPEEVAQRLLSETSALCVVNTKRAARELYERLAVARSGGVWHLSTNMCPAHRLEVLDLVRQRLAAGQPCLLVSTQLIEAGVDLDFPVVFRQLAPLDSMIQAAGRCNRERLLNGPDDTPGGRVIVFSSSEWGSPAGDYTRRTGIVQRMLAQGRPPDLNSPADIQECFERFQTEEGEKLDHLEIQPARERFKFATVAEKYQLIRDDTLPVVVTQWPSHAAAIARLVEQAGKAPTRKHLRALAKYQVNLHRNVVVDRFGAEVLDKPVIVWDGDYDPAVGIDLNAAPDLVC